MLSNHENVRIVSVLALLCVTQKKGKSQTHPALDHKMASEEAKTKSKGGCRFPTITTVFLSLCMICFLPPASGFFLRSCRISKTNAICKENNLKTIPQDIPPTATNLDLSKNLIENIQASNVTNLPVLSSLDLFHNHIAQIDSDAFAGLISLRCLDLNHNKLTHLGDRVFNGLRNLTELRLNTNGIKVVSPTAFQSLTRLKYLDISHNKLETIASLRLVLQHMPQLYKLVVKGNSLKNFHSWELTNRSLSLATLDLSGNPLNDFRITADIFPNLTCFTIGDPLSKAPMIWDVRDKTFLKQVSSLDISGLNMALADTDALLQAVNSSLKSLSMNSMKLNLRELVNISCSIPTMSTLELQSNNLKFISSDFLKLCINVTELHLEKNFVNKIQEDAFSSLGRLRTLSLSHNRLSSVPNATKNLQSLSKLDLSYNRIKTVGCQDFHNLTKLVELNLQNNSISALKDCLFNNLDIGFICFVSTTSMIVFVMVASFSYHFMRWQLYSAYYLFLSWLFDTKQKNKQAPCQYDAFISYNYHDEPWVIGELLPKLEGQQGWRLCLHHRDFEPGKPIIDNITDAIYSSRKTICVISRRYLESEWCSREVQTASFRLFDEQEDVLILVFLEDIPTYLLSPYHRMRKLLKKQTYLSWPRAADQPEVFWEKLRKALQTGNDPCEDNLLLNVTQTQ
ncbi:hypothetical protein ILYODFUR_016352 [Ilyodon furcidens]|uniref:TIR domain-containing protein n=1 Tax=Ilyodon furcidens TaxID=33524 RepID=A0ABV0U6H7_9TELE